MENQFVATDSGYDFLSLVLASGLLVLTFSLVPSAVPVKDPASTQPVTTEILLLIGTYTS